MFKTPTFAITAGSLYLLLYIIVAQLQLSQRLVLLMFALSPVLILWMIYVTIRHGKYSGEELKEGEEWGYEDKKKEDLRVF